MTVAVSPIEVTAQPVVLAASVVDSPIDIDVANPTPVVVDVSATALTAAINDSLSVTVALPGAQGIPGRVGAAALAETPAGLKNGINTVFTTAVAFAPNTTAVYLNGLREFHYAETGSNEITFEDAPASTDAIRVDYVI